MCTIFKISLDVFLTALYLVNDYKLCTNYLCKIVKFGWYNLLNLIFIISHRYGSQRMKDWLDVVKNYEKENLYLAEAAQILVRNISYEIPGLKKQIAKEEQLQTVCIKIHFIT